MSANTPSSDAQPADDLVHREFGLPHGGVARDVTPHAVLAGSDVGNVEGLRLPRGQRPRPFPSTTRLCTMAGSDAGDPQPELSPEGAVKAAGSSTNHPSLMSSIVASL